MTTSSSMLAVPIYTQHVHRTQSQTNLKRKRTAQDNDIELTKRDQDGRDSLGDEDQSLEYTAVVTPLERVQRRLAGLPIDQTPPALPFPHAPTSQRQNHTGRNSYKEDIENNNAKARSHVSLHMQHLAAMTAILHRCMMAQDYIRASRALGLLLRNEVGGRAVDIRSEGLWGIGAEVLFRPKDLESSERAHNMSRPPIVTRDGFQRARLFYERLIVQHPQHKTWPDAVNELDFCLALLGLWVYFANEESQRMQAEQYLLDDDDSMLGSPTAHLFEAKQWEYEQAKQISEAMDARMRNVPFNGNHDMLRLRHMVALWTADLIDDCIELKDVGEREARSHGYEFDDDFSNQVERMVIDVRNSEQPHLDPDEAIVHRALAQTLLHKLKKSIEVEQ